MVATFEVNDDTWERIREYDEVRRVRKLTVHQRRLEQVMAIGRVIGGKRDEAVTFRLVSGIEEHWLESEEKYQGIDNMNRSAMGGRQWTKSATPNGPLTAESEAKNSTRSSVYPRLAARYVDSVFAKVCEMILSPDDKSFAITPTPVPDLMGLKHDTTQIALNGQPLTKALPPPPADPSAMMMPQNGAPPAMPGMAPQGQPAAEQPPPPQEAPLTVADIVQEYMNMARDRAKLAEARIFDWLVESRHTYHYRKLIFDCIRIGVGVLKGPFPKTYVKRKVNREKLLEGAKRGDRSVTIETLEEVRPSVTRVNPWNFFPSSDCGDNPKNGDYCFERAYMSPKQVRALKKEKGYIHEMIDRALEHGPKSANIQTEKKYAGTQDGANQFEVWYGYVTLTAEEFETINPELAKTFFSENEREKHKELHAIVTMVQDTPVYATINPLESGAFPYHTVPYIYREDSWAGESLPGRLDVPQRILVGATRAMMNNAGVSSGSQFIIERDGLEPANGSAVIEPDKVWYRTNEAVAEDVRKLFMAIDIPNKTKELYQVVEYAMRLAEESSNLPLVTEGFSGKNSPETFGASQIQNSNAAQMLRELAHNMDHYINEPLLQQCYEWLLLDPDVPEEEKGDWAIQAHGSTAMVERSLQDQFILQMATLVAQNPDAFNADLKKMFVELLKARGLDHRAYTLSDEDAAKRPPPPPPPQVMAAQIREQGAMQREQLRLQQSLQLEQAQIAAGQQMAELDAQIDAEKLRVVDANNQAEQDFKRQELDLQKQFYVARYANERGLNLENAKKELAITAMKIKLQRELSLLKASTDVVKPPAEPQGKAPKGQAFVG